MGEINGLIMFKGVQIGKEELYMEGILVRHSRQLQVMGLSQFQRALSEVCKTYFWVSYFQRYFSWNFTVAALRN